MEGGGDSTNYRPLTYRKVRRSLKTGHFTDTICRALPDPAETGALAYAMESEPVLWIGRAAKGGQQSVGQVGDNS
jgi:hypothetical protein